MTGKLTSPQAANAAIDEYKAAVHSLEEVSMAIGTTSERRNDARVELLRVEADTLMTRVDMVTFVALVLAVGLAIWVTAMLRAAG